VFRYGMFVRPAAVHDNDEMAAPLVFISYRRTDSQQAALGLYVQLRARIGPGSVFMDRSGISAGDVWSQRLREAINQATVVLALIGSGWLRSADQYGRRRLDMPDDWVRNELLAAIDSGKPVIPILLGPLPNLPPAEALPDRLERLSTYQAYSLRDDHWDSDLNDLVRLLIDRHEFKEADRKVLLPTPEVSIKPLTQTELDNELKLLSGWELVESLIPGDYPKSRHELRKVYVFKSFRSAIQFMSSAVVPIDRIQHHPRWENQWRSVTVYLSTWDIGFRVSQFDIDLAKVLDGVYKGLTRLRAKSPVTS
jgi:pterin-4a-carbinolamine dehydratase